MPQPDARANIVSGPLQNVSIQYKTPQFIGDKIFPIIPNVSPKAKIARYLKGAWYRDEAGIRAAGTRAKRGGYPTDYLDVSAAEYAFAKEVTDEDIRYANVPGAPPLQPAIDAVEFCSMKIDLAKEARIAALIKATTWIDGNSGGDDADGKWAASASNTFLVDIATGVKAIHNATGIKPNCLLMDLGTFLSLKEESTVLDKIKYTQRGVLTTEILAALLELDEVMVGMAFKDSTKETKAGTTFTSSPIWEITATKGMGFLFYRPASVGLKVPAAGMQARVDYEGGMARRTMSWREEAEHQTVYEVAENCDILVTGSDLGYMWKDTLLT
jgi:hypothetical protein